MKNIQKRALRSFLKSLPIKNKSLQVARFQQERRLRMSYQWNVNLFFGIDTTKRYCHHLSTNTSFHFNPIMSFIAVHRSRRTNKPVLWLHYFIGAASMTDFFNGSYTTVCSQTATNSYGTHEMPKSSQGAPMPPTSICQLSIIF